MSAPGPQTYSTHRRWVPLYHFVTPLILLANLGYAIWLAVTGFSVGAIFHVSLVVALVLMYYYLRAFPVATQDRLIRLEERMRLAQLLPDDLKPRIAELTTGQLIGLRFASDGELPALARRVLDEQMADREEIKKLVTTWRPDDQRV